MKKMTILALCALAFAGVSAQTAPDPTSAEELYNAGKAQYDAYKKGKEKLSTNPADPAADPVTMADALINGYDYYMQVLPLDQLPNEKGQVKPKYTGKIIKAFVDNNGDYFYAGNDLFRAQKYPEAYKAYLIYADMPEMEILGNKAPQTPATDRAQAYYNAGLAAQNANEYVKSADAFKKAWTLAPDEPKYYFGEIGAWQILSQKDTTMLETAKNRIYDVAKVGNEKFGMTQPLFLINMVNSMVDDGKEAVAIDIINSAIAENPELPSVYELRGYVYTRSGNYDAAVADYKKAASLPGVTFETLKKAANRIYRTGLDKWEKLEMSDKAGRESIRAEYFLPAKEIADKAYSEKQDDGDLNYVLENINYTLESYFK